MSFISVIIAGGIGERFWPLSTPENPKQFINIWSGKSMLETTMERLARLSCGDEWVITTENLKSKTVSVGIPEHRVIGEPRGMNTAMAVALAAFVIGRNRSQDILGIFPADHVVQDVDLFYKRINQAMKIAAQDKLVIFGIKPDRPDTGYGYIEVGSSISENVFEVSMFREKPDKATAETFLNAGNFFWNSGMFVFKVDTIQKAFQKYVPELKESIDYLQQYAESNDPQKLILAYQQAVKMPVDVAVMERADNIACVQGDFLWDDVGSWMALKRLKSPDQDGNVIIGPVETHQLKNSIVVNEHSKIIVMGLENVVVIQSKQGTLVTSEQHIDKLKQVLQQIK
ncbi:MAG: mannose-1-phosphate guanylyltransferase [bacterium]